MPGHHESGRPLQPGGPGRGSQPSIQRKAKSWLPRLRAHAHRLADLGAGGVPAVSTHHPGPFGQLHHHRGVGQVTRPARVGGEVGHRPRVDLAPVRRGHETEVGGTAYRAEHAGRVLVVRAPGTAARGPCRCLLVLLTGDGRALTSSRSQAEEEGKQRQLFCLSRRWSDHASGFAGLAQGGVLNAQAPQELHPPQEKVAILRRHLAAKRARNQYASRLMTSP